MPKAQESFCLPPLFAKKRLPREKDAKSRYLMLTAENNGIRKDRKEAYDKGNAGVA